MLYITSSNGIFSYDPVSGEITNVITNKNRGGFFSKKSHGFFGVCLDQNNNIIVASREKLGTKKSGKPTTDVGLHLIDSQKNTFTTIGYIKDIHDVHQIDTYKNSILLTDTGKNRIVVYSISSEKISHIINIGELREDINHVNAVTIVDNQILVGLNNRGTQPSEILHLPLSILNSDLKVIEAYDFATAIDSLSPYTNTHDIEPFKNSYLVCSSHDSVVFETKSLKPVIESEKWVRGISHDDKYIWVAQSINAKRSKRHSKAIDGSVLKINSNTMEVEDIISISGTGQINDLQYVIK